MKRDNNWYIYLIYDDIVYWWVFIYIKALHVHVVFDD